MSISIHAPRVGSDGQQSHSLTGLRHISIHAPRVGSDSLIDTDRCMLFHFYPRSPRGERPEVVVEGVVQRGISIHAPRVGSDYSYARGRGRYAISIHAPRVGSDRQFCGQMRLCSSFLSTLPAWGATAKIRCNVARVHISIHAPRVGSDVRM